MLSGYEKVTLVKMRRSAKGPRVTRIGGNPEILLDEDQEEFLIPAEQVIRCINNARLKRVVGTEPAVMIQTPDKDLITVEDYKQIVENYREESLQAAESNVTESNVSADALEVFSEEDEEDEEEDEFEEAETDEDEDESEER